MDTTVLGQALYVLCHPVQAIILPLFHIHSSRIRWTDNKTSETNPLFRTNDVCMNLPQDWLITARWHKHTWKIKLSGTAQYCATTASLISTEVRDKGTCSLVCSDSDCVQWHSFRTGFHTITVFRYHPENMAYSKNVH